MAGREFSGAPYSREEFKDIPVAGHIFSYESGGVKTTFNDARQKAKSAGFNEDLVDTLMPDITKEQAWRRARKKFAGRRNGLKVDITPAARTADYLKHQVTFKRIDETKGKEKVDFVDSFMCIWQKADEKLIFDGVGSSKDKKLVATKLRSMYEELCKVINTSTVRHFCQKVAEQHWSPVPIRKRGGVWFALSEYTEEMEKMEKFFSNLGGDYAFYMVPIVDMASERKKVSRWVGYGMETDMEALKAEFTRKLEEAKATKGDKKGLVTGRAMQGFVNRAENFVQKLGVYEQALNYKAKDLRGSAGEVKSMVAEVLTGKVPGVAVEGAEPGAKKKSVKKVVKKEAEEVEEIEEVDEEVLEDEEGEPVGVGDDEDTPF